ncbi:MAG: hypothetical protein J5642_03855 [Bacteroidales bacterium]|nr:hypothetical protein [Bacteroidales bacterium]
MKGKQICKYLKAVRREIATANGIALEIPECTFEGECKGTCPRCENEVRQLEKALVQRRKLSQRVAVLGVAAGLSLMGMPAAIAQTELPTDSVEVWGDLGAEPIERIVCGWVPAVTRWENPLIADGRTSTIFNFANETPLARIGNAKISDKTAEYKVCDAMFPDGTEAMQKYIREQWRGPSRDDQRDAGNIIVGFWVSARGKVNRVKVQGNLTAPVAREIKRVFLGMPSWKPATVDGTAVSSYVEVSLSLL